jgi:hypothetical protein
LHWLTLCALVVGCGDDASSAPLGDRLCPVVQAWADQTADAVDAFRLDSRALDVNARRERYRAAFAELAALNDRFGQTADELDLPDAVADRLDEALMVVAQTTADGEAEASGLPDAAYEFVAVRDGSLVTTSEKSRAVVFQALSDLADDPTSEVPAGCGRRGALDLSPSATFP